jgi:endonuclease III
LPVAKRESRRARKSRTLEIVERLREMYPDSRCSLDHDNSFQLLLATVLSAQCTDAAVNRATPELFRRWPSPESLGGADPLEVEEVLRSLNYYRNKARALVGIGQALVERFGGDVPATLEELTTLPGVGRKTANVVLGVGFGVADGVVVDTHVKRIVRRLGLTTAQEPERVEADLIPLLPAEERIVFTHRVIDHGRAICQARQPLCSDCALAGLCPTAPAAAA